MPGDVSVADADALDDAALYYALPSYVDLADAAASAEMDWLNARSTGAGTLPKKLLEAYMASLVPRRCRLSGVVLACAPAPGGHRAHAADLYFRIRLSTPSRVYRDQIYECHYPSAQGALADLAEAKVGEEAHFAGWLERSFSVPGFYLARPRLYRGPKRP